MRLRNVMDYRCRTGAWTLALWMLLHPSTALALDFASLESALGIELDLLLALVALVALLATGYLYLSRRAQRQLLAAQKQEREKLDQLVKARTAALQDELIHRADADQQRLLLERRLAEDDKLRVLGQLTGGVAHDFNNLLTVVMGSAELLRSRVGSQDSDDRRLVDHIIAAATSGAGITRALMAYARQQPLRLEKTDLGRFLVERLPLMKRSLGGSLSVELDVHEGPAIEVMLDRDQLTTALLNLTLNARDAQNNSGIIRVVLGREDARTAFLSVVDFGAGMTAEQIRRACEPFYSTKKDGEGNGLGLSMVYGFTKQLGGDLQIHSIPGEGTEVRMLLPLSITPSDLQVA